jgi:signal transduction histidine kinase
MPVAKSGKAAGTGVRGKTPDTGKGNSARASWREFLLGPEGGNVEFGITVLKKANTPPVVFSGPGLDPSHLERVFDAFYSRKHDGLGIGLSICRSIIEAHGGRLWATANTPQGAIFQFTLPEHTDGPRN